MSDYFEVVTTYPLGLPRYARNDGLGLWDCHGGCNPPRNRVVPKPILQKQDE